MFAIDIPKDKYLYLQNNNKTINIYAWSLF